MCFLVMPVIINRLTQILLIAFYCTYFSTVILLMSRPTRAILNWANYRHNYELARKLADGMAYGLLRRIGYGQGCLNCAKALGEADGFVLAGSEKAFGFGQEECKRPNLCLQGA